ERLREFRRTRERYGRDRPEHCSRMLQHDSRFRKLDAVALIGKRLGRWANGKALDPDTAALHGRDFAPDESVAHLGISIDQISYREPSRSARHAGLFRVVLYSIRQLGRRDHLPK